MRQLTLNGYLAAYVQHLAGEQTLSLSRLAVLCPSKPRLTAPLLLWAAATERSARMSTLLEGQPKLQAELTMLVELQQQGHLEQALADEDGRLRPEYSKAWRSYVVRRDANLREMNLKLKARKQTLDLEAAKRVSRYRMAKDLGLNPGNLHAFLGQANASKLSLDRAYELVKYLEAASPHS